MRSLPWSASCRARALRWTDIGDVIEHGGEHDGQIYRERNAGICPGRPREGVEAGIKIGMSRASNGSGNGHLTLPKPLEMAQYCHDRLGRLKDDKQRDFVGDMYVDHASGVQRNLSVAGQAGILGEQSTFKIGGKT